jgi:hypothetical protein
MIRWPLLRMRGKLGPRSETVRGVSGTLNTLRPGAAAAVTLFVGFFEI